MATRASLHLTEVLRVNHISYDVPANLLLSQFLIVALHATSIGSIWLGSTRQLGEVTGNYINAKGLVTFCGNLASCLFLNGVCGLFNKIFYDLYARRNQREVHRNIEANIGYQIITINRFCFPVVNT